jgi:hypothetical protein
MKPEALKLVLEELESDYRERRRRAMIEDDDDIQDYKKPWVSLTDEEIDKTYWRREPFRRPTQFEFARDIEQLLKEKNT